MRGLTLRLAEIGSPFSGFCDVSASKPSQKSILVTQLKAAIPQMMQFGLCIACPNALQSPEAATGAS
jgi:hypothetical protein